MSTTNLFLGIDIGTSGCRAIAIDTDGKIHAQSFTTFPPPTRTGSAIEQSADIWWQGVVNLLQQLSQQISLAQICGLAIDGTSGTVIAIDHQGRPLHPALMYNDGRAIQQAKRIATLAPTNSAAHGVSSGLAKVLWLLEQEQRPITRLINQSDWIVGQFSGHYNLSDYNNCIKLGYDATTHCWPDWLKTLMPIELLPTPHAPATRIAQLSADAARITGLNLNTPIYAGTTDSTAAVYASGASQPGDAITSLGSTLVTKVITEQPLFLPSAGVYSQPFGKHWLVGGGSNSGGNVLLHFFTPEQMRSLSSKIDPNIPSGLDYYPLLSAGERFPVCDPKLSPRLEPRPSDDAAFFHGLLEGITKIEHQAFCLLEKLGAPYPQRIYSSGGGSANPAWTQIRANILGCEILRSEQQEAAYGVAKLARDGHNDIN